MFDNRLLIWQNSIEGDVNSPVSRHRYLYGNANPVSYSDPSNTTNVG
jgi:hypothetical protein